MPPQRGDPLLNPGAPRVVKPNYGRTVLDGEVEDPADLPGVSRAEAPPHETEILGIDVYPFPVDGPGAGDHAVPEPLPLLHPEGYGLMLHVGIELNEAPLVKEGCDPLPRRELSLRVLALRGGLLLPP